MAVSLNFGLTFGPVETLTSASTPNATTPAVTHDKLNSSVSLSGTSTPVVSMVASNQKLMSAGAGTIDLTAVPSTNNATYNGNGLKVVAFAIQALATNAGAITVKFGAANPYNLFGASGQITIGAGEWVEKYFISNGTVIGAGAKNIDLSGTTTDGISYIFVMG